MSAEEWAELLNEPHGSERQKDLLGKTEKETEHPEEYNGPCFCALCRSYT